EAEADAEEKELPAAAVVTAADAVPAEAASTPEAAAPVKEAIAWALGTSPVPAPAKGKAKGSAEGAGKVAAADAEETEQTREDVILTAQKGFKNQVSTSAEGDKDNKEDSLLESARRGNLNKVSTSAEGNKDKKQDSLLEAVRDGDLNKVKEFLENERDPDLLSNAWVSGQETFANIALAADPSAKAADGKSSGTRPLIAAAVLGHSHVLRELLQSRADVDLTDSNGLTALSAAFCSPNCDIHTRILLHHAVDQERKKHDQSSDAREGFRQEVDIREDYFLHSLCDGKMNAKTMADVRADKIRTERMLVTLLRGEGQIFTKMVAGLLKEVEPGSYRSERLKERMRTVLCDYARDRQQARNFLGVGRKSSVPRQSVILNVFADDRAKKREDVDAFNLSWHNMLYAPEVQVSLQSLPIPATLACEPSVLAALAETANEETLQTDAVEAITAAAWLQMRVATAVENFLNCVALGCLCLVTWACRKGDMDAQPALWVLAIIQFKDAVELLSQLGFYGWSSLFRMTESTQGHVDRVNGKEMKLLGDADVSFVQPAPGLETLVDVFFLVAGCFAIYGQMDLCSAGELEPIFLPGFCSMYWLRLMYSLRGERWLGPYLLPILSAVRDTGAFFFVTSLCVASATHAYVIMNPRGEDEYPIYSSFLHTVRLAIFGDFDLFEYQGQDTTFQLVEGEWAPNDPNPKDVGEDPNSPYWPYIYLQLCFFGTGIGITVLLMNLLIAILSQNYEMQQGRAQGLFVQARASMLLEVQRRPWRKVGVWLGHKLFDPEAKKPLPKKPPPPYLHLGTLAEIALRPLTVVMEPFVPGAYYQKNVFERVLQRALWSPVAKQNFLAVGIPVACVVLLAGSLVSLLAFACIILVLKLVGFQLTGFRPTEIVDDDEDEELVSVRSERAGAQGVLNMFEILEFLDIEHLGAIVNQNSAGDDLLVTSREFRDLLNRHLQSMTSNWQQMHNRIGEIEQNVDFAKKDRAILHSRVTQVERKGADLEVKEEWILGLTIEPSMDLSHYMEEVHLFTSRSPELDNLDFLQYLDLQEFLWGMKNYLRKPDGSAHGSLIRRICTTLVRDAPLSKEAYNPQGLEDGADDVDWKAGSVWLGEWKTGSSSRRPPKGDSVKLLATGWIDILAMARATGVGFDVVLAAVE
ncbi:unnamed protein product, partial [Symbiodinium microadriaticum]